MATHRLVRIISGNALLCLFVECESSGVEFGDEDDDENGIELNNDVVQNVVQSLKRDDDERDATHSASSSSSAKAGRTRDDVEAQRELRQAMLDDSDDDADDSKPDVDKAVKKQGSSVILSPREARSLLPREPFADDYPHLVGFRQRVFASQPRHAEHAQPLSYSRLGAHVRLLSPGGGLLHGQSVKDRLQLSHR